MTFYTYDMAKRDARWIRNYIRDAHEIVVIEEMDAGRVGRATVRFVNAAGDTVTVASQADFIAVRDGQ